MLNRFFIFMLGFIVVSNLIDAIATAVWVNMGLATEFNPLMAGILDSGPGKFILIKMILINLCVYLLWRFKDKSLSKWLVTPVFLIYTYILLIHLYILSQALGPWRHLHALS